MTQEELDKLIGRADSGSNLGAYVAKACGVVGILGVIGAIGYLAYSKATISIAVLGVTALVATLAGFSVNWSTIGFSASEFKAAISKFQEITKSQATQITNLSVTADELVKEKAKLMEQAALADKAHNETTKIAKEAVEALAAQKLAADKLASDKVAADAARLEAEARAQEARKTSVQISAENKRLRDELEALKKPKPIEIEKAPSASA